MVGYTQKIAIKDIIILTANNEITISGTVNRNTMSYETQMFLDNTQLNLVINQLQRINPNQEVSDMFQSCYAENGQILYYFDGSLLENVSVEVHSFTQNREILQIRA